MITKSDAAQENTGHGHVYPRPDGIRARCGGPGICAECSREAARKASGETTITPTPVTVERLHPCPFCGGEPEIERVGTSRASCIVICSDCSARNESADVGQHSGRSWNRRSPAVDTAGLLARLPTYDVGPIALGWIRKEDLIAALQAESPLTTPVAEAVTQPITEQGKDAWLPIESAPIVKSWRDDPPSGSQRVFAWLRGRPELAALIDADSTPHEVGLGLDVVWAEQSWFCANVEQFDQALTRETADLRREVERMREALSALKPHSKWLHLAAERLHKQQREYSIANTCEEAADAIDTAMRQGGE